MSSRSAWPEPRTPRQVRRIMGAISSRKRRTAAASPARALMTTSAGTDSRGANGAVGSGRNGGLAIACRCGRDTGSRCDSHALLSKPPARGPGPGPPCPVASQAEAGRMLRASPLGVRRNEQTAPARQSRLSPRNPAEATPAGSFVRTQRSADDAWRRQCQRPMPAHEQSVHCKARAPKVGEMRVDSG